METLPEKIIERLKTCTNFPSPPPVALKVIELAQDPNTDLHILADTCSGDPAIAAKIMKIANSALYVSRRVSTNLRQALIVLGLNATLTLALSFTLVSGLRRDPPKGFDFLAYWRRAILAATWGKLLATELKQPFAEEVFIASLLQDIGMLAIDRIAPEIYEDISPLQLDHSKLMQHEINQIGFDHAAVGGWLLSSWNMPKELVRAISHSHDIEAANIEPKRRMYVRIIAMSGQIADAWLSGNDEVALQRISTSAEKYLGITPNKLVKIFEIIKEQLPVTSELFDMDLFEEKQLSEITDAAREILMIRNLHALSDASELQMKASVLQSENKELRHETTLDGLTGIGNRRFFEDSLTKEFEIANRHKWPLSMIFVDIDNFKTINDLHGHPAGDDVLRGIVKMITSVLRCEDIVARYGGDEFVVLLPGSDTNAVRKIADRIVSEAVNCGAMIKSTEVILPTLSLGVVTMNVMNEFETPKELLAAADKALYCSKKAGRNRHTSYGQIKVA